MLEASAGKSGAGGGPSARPPQPPVPVIPSVYAVIDIDPYVQPSTSTSSLVCVSEAAPASPARYSSGMKWSGVGTA